MVTKSITEEVADLVAAAISRANRTKSYVSAVTGIPRTTLNRKVDGYADFTVAEIDRIAAALGLEGRDLLPERMRPE